MIKLYNTLTKKVEEVERPTDRRLNMYTCGPTIYNFAHIGNLRAYIVADLLYRTLKLDSYNPKWVMNLTDIDDKTIKGTLAEFGAQATAKDLFNFTEKYKQAFLEDLRAVNVLVDEIEIIRVTDKMTEIQEFVVGLLNKGYAYKAEDGSTYFNIEKYQADFADYGQLVGEKFLEGKKVGARVAVDEYEKDNLSDFALWKAYNPESDGNIYWEHELLGKGRPGWHIECSVINQVAFHGQPVDIHTGGVDLMFPHHTNEIAQSQALLGKGNFVKCWSHSEHLMVDGQRMGKRFNNFYTLRNLKEKGFSGIDLRYFFFSAHYTSTQNFTWEALEAAHNGLKKLKDLPLTNEKAALDKALSDLQMPDAVAETFLQNSSPASMLDLFGIPTFKAHILPKKVLELVEKRKMAKETKDFAKSDQIRKEIEELGYEVKDTKEGQVVNKI
ncbi:MAG: class I tRNA ligase family protein [Candidatus Doudnabacteria bacterium]|nr:class I tRNA ligase family protein [Candidatus Doudnabacteria bacterium]